MIEFALLTFFLIVLVGWIAEIILHYQSPPPCKHKVKLSYHSRKEFQCCDCGKRLPMEYDDYPRHQR